MKRLMLLFAFFVGALASQITLDNEKYMQVWKLNVSAKWDVGSCFLRPSSPLSPAGSRTFSH